MIISDIVMPGMDGYEFCAKLKSHQLFKQIPVILLTSLRDPLDIIKGLQAGADNFITKPYEEKFLLTRIKYLLTNREFGPSSTEDRVIELVIDGKKYPIQSEKKQILDLLLSVYEAAIQRNDELIYTQQQLEISNENLVSMNHELEAFSYTVSHDLRNPINIIAGFSQILMYEHDPQLDEEAMELLNNILQSTFSMVRLIDDLLQFSRSGRAVISSESFDFSEMARNVMNEVMKRDPEHQVKFYIQEGLLLHADPNLMRVVLDNLLGNAWKYSFKVSSPEIILGKAEGTSGEHIFFVKDNGAGFDMAKADGLFNPFQRLHTNAEFQGTGVGLATVRRIIEKHGGRIWAESELYKGASFYFSIPE